MSDLVPTRPPSVRIDVVVSPRACGDEVLGWAGGALRLRVAAPGRRGRADVAVETLLAEVLGVPRERVHVVAGRGTRRKCVEIEGYDDRHLDHQLPGRHEAAAPTHRSPRRSGVSTAVQPAAWLRSGRAVAALRRGATH